MTAVSVDVTTGDAAPAAAPHRISGQPSKDEALVTIHTEPNEGLLPGDELPEETDVFPSSTLYPSATLYPGAGGLVPDRDHTQIVGVRVNVGGVSPYTGQLVGQLGLPCSEQLACSEDLPGSDWEAAAGDDIAEDVTFVELGGLADGDYTVNAWVDFAGEWQ